MVICRLGAKHDENPEECPTKQYIMSATIVKTTQDRLDTYHTFSTCSARQIQNTLSGSVKLHFMYISFKR